MFAPLLKNVYTLFEDMFTPMFEDIPTPNLNVSLYNENIISCNEHTICG